MNKLKKTILLLSIFFSLVASGQVTIEECQTLARENYPLLKKYGLINAATEYTVSNAGKGYLPQVSFNGQATFQSEVVELPHVLKGLVSSQGYDLGSMKKDQYKLGIDVSQVIYDGGNISASKECARAEGAVQTRQAEVDMYSINERVNGLFFGILLIEENIRLNGDLQSMLSDNCRKIEAKVKGGTAMQCDADAMKAELLNSRQHGIELQSIKESYVCMLEIFIGKDIIGELVKPVAEIPEDYSSQRPEMRLFEAQESSLRSQLKKIDAGVMPRVSLFAQGYYGYPGYNMFEAMTEHKLSLNGLVGVRLNWNIGNFYTRKNERRKLETNIAMVENAREVFLFNTDLQTTEQENAINCYRKMMGEDDDIIALRTSVRIAAEAKLEHGIIETNDLIQEITRENEAKIAKSSHEIEMLKSIYELRNTINK
ncbi:MAG: TolC family protein [Muribaculaceae bacterium]